MGRTKGSKNKSKNDDKLFVKTPVKKEKIKIDIVSIKQGKPRKLDDGGYEEFEEPTTKPAPTVKKDEKILKVEGVMPKKESPNIPEVLVDGGMLYRWLVDLRRHYDDYIVGEETKTTKIRIYQVIDQITDYIMRMEKKKNGNI